MFTPLCSAVGPLISSLSALCQVFLVRVSVKLVWMLVLDVKLVHMSEWSNIGGAVGVDITTQALIGYARVFV